MSLTSTISNVAVALNYTGQSEWSVNSWGLVDQLVPDVVGLSNGGFAFAYNNYSTTDGYLTMDFYDPAFHRIGDGDYGDWRIPNEGEIKLIGQPSVTQLNNGNVLVVWDDDQSGDAGIKGRLYTPDGTAVGGELDLFETTTTPADPQVAALNDGGFLVSFEFSGNVFVNRFDSAGTLQGGFQVNINALAGTQKDPAVIALTDGNYVVTYTNANPADQEIRAHIFNGATNADIKVDFLIGNTGDNTQSKVAALPNGNWAIVYTDSGWAEGGTLGNGITLQVFDPVGNNVTPGTYAHVNAASAVDEREPDIAVLDNGYILVTWTRPGANAAQNDVYGRVFTQDGHAATGEFAITATGTDSDSLSTVSGLASGQYVTIWQDSWDQDPLPGGDGGDNNGSGLTAEINEIVRTTTGDGSPDTFNGDELRDIVDTGGGIDVLNGGGGNDWLNGGTGADTMFGGMGDDWFYVDNAADVVIENVGQGNDRLFASVSFTLASGRIVEMMTTTDNAGISAINLTGNEIDQTIYGNAGANILDGKGGADTLVGLGGDDWYYVDNANDAVSEAGGGGVDDRVLASVDYTLGGGHEIEKLTTTNNFGLGSIRLTGNEFANAIYGNAGANILDGMGGADTLVGFGGDDWFLVDNAGDVVIEAAGEGTDQVFASVDYTLAAGVSVETLSTNLTPGLASLNLTGNELANTVIGNAGSNAIKGMAGNDVLYGGGGIDAFVFNTALNAATNVDTILDFSVADDDIVLASWAFTTLAPGMLSAGAFTVGATATEADDRIIYNSQNGALYYDPDGAGGAAQIQFGGMNAFVALTNADFVVV